MHWKYSHFSFLVVERVCSTQFNDYKIRYFWHSRSDETIQNVLKKRFQNCTILIIAHRLDTIMDVDRVMVRND